MMGVWTNGILFYGFAVVEDSDLHERIRSEGDDGEPNTDLGMMHYDGHVVDGVKIDTHCSGDWPLYYIAIAVSVQTARRGDVKVVNTETAPVGSDLWDEQLRAFCKKHDIEQAEFGWRLASYWG